MEIRKHALRFSIIFLTILSALFVFSVKLVLIQVFYANHLASLAEKQHNHLIEIEPLRGMIFDRRLRPLAINVPVYSLFVNPRMMSKEDKKKATQHLPALIHVNPQLIEDRLGKNKYFVWLQRKLSSEIVRKIKFLNIRGLDFIQENKRYYPNGEIAAHLLGFAGMDNDGLEGLELFYNAYLKGESGQALILRDARNRELLIEKDFIAPRDGFHLILTIDETVQYLAERALAKAVRKHNAKAGTIIVIDTRTGELLALANQPTYNLQSIESSELNSRTNRALSYVLEPGSVFKIVTAAAALEEKKFEETDKIFCENGQYRIANHILHDHHPHGTLTFREVFEKSSNIGVTKIAQALGPQVIYQYAKRFRFGEKTNIDLRGEMAGIVKSPSVWSKTTIGAIPIGHEVTVTPLQLVYAMAAIANDGLYMRPFVVKYIIDSHDQMIKTFTPQIVQQVISPATAQRLKEILVGVVENGTGQRAKIEGIDVAGKTGTAQKVIDGQYSHSKFYAAFVGFAPADHPRLAAVVVLEEPHPYYFGGTVSAPVFKEVIENSLKYLETSPELTDYKLSTRL